MKFKIRRNLFFTLILVLVFYNLGISQTKTYSTPVNWERYTVKGLKASFLLPKLPVVVEESNKCRGEETFAYGSYGEGAAYVVRITKKVDVPRFCREKKEFD